MQLLLVPSDAPIQNRASVVPSIDVSLSVKNNAPLTVDTLVVTVSEVLLVLFQLPHSISFAAVQWRTSALRVAPENTPPQSVPPLVTVNDPAAMP